MLKKKNQASKMQIRVPYSSLSFKKSLLFTVYLYLQWEIELEYKPTPVLIPKWMQITNRSSFFLMHNTNINQSAASTLGGKCTAAGLDITATALQLLFLTGE